MAKKATTTEHIPNGITFTGKAWITPDGRTFNTRLKAEAHLKSMENEPLKFEKKAAQNNT
jgi:hypothetical protein